MQLVEEKLKTLKARKKLLLEELKEIEQKIQTFEENNFSPEENQISEKLKGILEY